MLSVKLLVLDALIENMTALLCRGEAPAVIDAYLDMLNRLIHTRCALRTR